MDIEGEVPFQQNNQMSAPEIGRSHTEEDEEGPLINYDPHLVQERQRHQPGLLQVILDYTIYPIGRGIKYIIPNFIKRGITDLFRSQLPGEKFLENLKDDDVFTDEFVETENLFAIWQINTFKNAVFAAHFKRKPILFIMADLMNDESLEILQAIFHDEETLKIISSNFIVFGVEYGNTEGDNLALEFDIRISPHFGIIMAKSDTEYDDIACFNDANVEIEGFRTFLTNSFGTFKYLSEAMARGLHHQAPENLESSEDLENPEIYQIDFEAEQRRLEDRAIREQQKREYEKAQEEDRLRFLKRKEEEHKEKLKQQEAENLAQKKKDELPSEPSEGTIIKFREPENGKTFIRKFNPSDTVSILYDYVQSKLDEIEFEEDTVLFEIGVIEGGFKVLEDREKTLEQEGLCPSATLHIREVGREEESEEED
ncbi:unnamed protein product [Moneuplotes crassus]|uniref:UBX domain-containing protein n=1 Tax=Euplotes crassus TaxID=5936 RepID=A0AAD1UM36_EUPCR|nr:unnamed protein product [Moneuplotes crassus]